MADYDLKGFQASSIYQLGELVGAVRLEEDWMDFRSETRIICDHFLTLASAALLADMKINLFFLNLCRSAENWRRFLVTSRDHYNRHVPLTYNAPLYAAVIANDKNILLGIVDALPKHWLKGEEYEDQFLAGKLHTSLACNGCQLDDDVQTHLNALEEAEAEPLNSALFKALLGVDELKEADFWSEFEAALLAHELQIVEKISSVATKISQFIAHRFVWYEGLSWLRLALIKGFTPPKGIKYCPDEALETMPELYQGDWTLVPLSESTKQTSA